MERTTRRTRLCRIAASTVGVLALAACTTAADASPESDPESVSVESPDADSSSALDPATTSTSDTAVAETDAVDTGDEGELDLGAVGTLSSSETHAISVDLDDADYAAMLETYSSTGDKEWIDATVTIDGTTYDEVGLRLKGNSSLRSVSTDDAPETLPWLIKLDKFVDAQNHEGLTDLVIRSNNSATALNEAVALELLGLAGLASQDAIAVSFSVNGGDSVLRLAIEHPDDNWMAEELDAHGALYKAESTGDYSYRGDDPDSYDEVFDQEAGDDNADLTPLIEFLDFINNADDATFVAELEDWLDIDSFTTYLAMQELIGNFDDIDGPGNNSYLFYDTGSETFTVVPWDHNLAFGQGLGGFGGRRGQAGEGAAPDGALPPDFDGDFEPPPGGFGGPGGPPEDVLPPDSDRAGEPPTEGFGGFGGPGGRSNVLVERFLENDEWQAQYTERSDELRELLYGSGVADDVLAEWRALVEATGLVDPDTIDSEATSIGAQFD